MSQSRQLAAIMFTDIVGYTALMGRDEDKALLLLNANRQIQKPLIEKYHGKWLKELGDGVLAQFNSAYDAVKCAIEIQKAAQVLEGQLRIGIHLGDVTNEDNDVFGDGVNVASRIQGIADPGSIYISESIENAIRNRSDIKTKYLGEAELKNVNYSVKVYAIQGKGFPVAASITKPKKTKQTGILLLLALVAILGIAGWLMIRNISKADVSKIQSLVILPISNLTGSEEQQYMVEGIHDALISELSQINSLRVISRTSAMGYANSNKSVPQIGRELKVDAVVESTLLLVGDSIRMNVQLIRINPEEAHIWAGFFDHSIQEVLKMISEVTQAIAKNIRAVLSPEEEKLVAGIKTVDPEIYKLYLQGKFQLDKHTPEGFKIGLAILNQAIEKDPTNPLPLAALAFGYSDLAHLPAPPQDAFPRAKALALRALALDSNLAESNVAMAIVNLYYDWDYKAAQKYFHKALELDSNHATACAHYGWLMDILGRKMEAEKYMILACELDPLVSIYRAWLASWYWGEKRLDEAERDAKRLLAIEPDHTMANWVLGGVYADKGNYKEAILLHKKIETKSSQFKFALGKTYAQAGLQKEALEFLDGMEETPRNALGFASIYSSLGDMDNALKWAEVVKKTRHPFTAWLDKPYFAEAIKNDPRFLELFKSIIDSVSRS